MIALLAVWVLLRLAGERWWPATLLLFSPRWLLSIPLALLLPLAVLCRRSLAVLGTAAIVIAGPIMGLCLPWRRVFPAPQGEMLHVLSCNAHGNALNVQALADLIRQSDPDVVAIQERPTDVRPLFMNGQWHVFLDGELCLASRYPGRRVREIVADGDWGLGIAVHYELFTRAGGIQFYNVHLASPQSSFSAMLRNEPGASARIQANSDDRRRQVQTLATDASDLADPVVLAGDFNTPDDSPLFSHSLYSFSDAFSYAGAGFGWTYRTSDTLARIDHLLARGPLRFRRCYVGPQVGSPHRPLMAELTLQRPSGTKHGN